MNILLVEDEQKVAAFIKKGLEEEQHRVTHCADGIAGAEQALRENYDCIILDVMLPGIDGYSVCEKLRRHQVHSPILMLTALQNVDDIVTGLSSGADDYLTKPFHFRELLARITALTKRQRGEQTALTRISFHDITLDTESKTAWRQDREIQLTAREYALLELFMRNPRKVMSRAFILDAVWGYNQQSNGNVVDVYVNYLRNKIEKPFTGAKLIHTITSMGYVMKYQE